MKQQGVPLFNWFLLLFTNNTKKTFIFLHTQIAKLI